MPRKKGEKLTLDDRSAIYAGISAKKSFPNIAKEIGVAPSTIYREVKANRTTSNPSGIRNFCVHIRTCTKEQLCKKRPSVIPSERVIYQTQSEQLIDIPAQPNQTTLNILHMLP